MFQKPISSCSRCIFGKAALPGRCPWSPVSRPAGATLISEGEIPERVMLVREGRVAEQAQDGHGALSIKGPGALLGLHGLRGQPASARVTALTPVKVCVLAPAQVVDWLEQGPGAARAMLELALDEGARAADENAWRRGPALSRVARFLIAQEHADAREPRDRLSKSIVAQMLGMRPETYSRCLHELTARRLVDARPPHAIRDLAELAHLAHADPGDRA